MPIARWTDRQSHKEAERPGIYPAYGGRCNIEDYGRHKESEAGLNARCADSTEIHSVLPRTADRTDKEGATPGWQGTSGTLSAILQQKAPCCNPLRNIIT